MYSISFNFKGQNIKFEDETIKSVVGGLIDFLHENGYKFEGIIHNAFTRKPVNLEEINNHSSSKYYLAQLRLFHKIKNSKKYIWIGGNVEPAAIFAKKMLINFGIDELSINITGFTSSNIPGVGLSRIKKFGEIDTDVEEFDLDEDDLTPVEEPISKIKVYKQNPFRQSICVLGKSGAGKSYTIDDILDKSNHEYEFIIPSASTTGLLSQFSPSAKEGRGGYIPSRLGKLIEKAYKNNSTLYTVVFDECHKSNIIEMINDELLQAISTDRNKNRFISLDDETSELYPSKILDRRGNIEITDNLGFIFISSNARVISGNDDFFNRVDLVEITKEIRDSVKTIEDLNRLRISDTDKKYELVSKIMSESKR